jgi:L,D-transpeptidase catalytic domain/LysM domain
LLLLGACTASRSGDDADSPGGEPPASASAATTDPPTTATPTPTIDPPATSADSPATTTTAPATSTTPATTAPPPSTTTTTTPPTTTVPPRPPRPPRNPCVWRVRPGDSLSSIADSVPNKRVTVRSLQRENGIVDADRINVGDKLDVCVGNRIDDITGKKRTPPPPPPPTRPPSAPSDGTGVAAQQQKINELFAGLGMPALAVDGDSGRLTEQQLCATRVALNLPISRADIEPGSPEEQALMSTRSLSIPSSAPIWAGRWALVDQTCQVMFVGEGEQLAFAFPVSTGEPEFPTRDQDSSRVFRYDPALENDGWHDSTLFPAAEDNPLNGNMYKPLYFDNGQAIHGANTVPPEPASHGCVRVPVDLQDILVNWLGLGDVGGATYDEDLIGLTVTVQGQY